MSIVAGAKNRPTSRAWMSPKANALSVTVGMDSVCAVTSDPTVRSVGPMLGTDELRYGVWNRVDRPHYPVEASEVPEGDIGGAHGLLWDD